MVAPFGGCKDDARPRSVAPPSPKVVSKPEATTSTNRATSEKTLPKAPATRAPKPAAQRPPRSASAKRPVSASKKVMWDAPIAWRSLSGAAEASKKSGKPILMMVFADW